MGRLDPPTVQIFIGPSVGTTSFRLYATESVRRNIKFITDSCSNDCQWPLLPIGAWKMVRCYAPRAKGPRPSDCHCHSAIYFLNLCDIRLLIWKTAIETQQF